MKSTLLLRLGAPLAFVPSMTLFAQTAPSFDDKLVAGSKIVRVIADKSKAAVAYAAAVPASNGVAPVAEVAAVAPITYTLKIYQLDAGYNALACPGADSSKRTLLMISVSSTTNQDNIATSTTATSNTLTLATPLQAGTALCVQESGGATQPAVIWSMPQAVVDLDDYGRVRTYFVAGVQVTNQQSSSASSTAGQYLEAGFNYTFIKARDGRELFPPTKGIKRRPGLSTNLDVRLSPIPVAAPTTTTTTSMTTTTSTAAATTTATATTSPNALTSQQSARVVGNMYFPFKTTHWNGNSDYFTLGPVLRGGFATLLNPSVGSVTPATTTTTTAATTTTAITATTANFNSAYSFIGYGVRLGWDRFPVSGDKAPQTITQFLVTLGSYSNLPSFTCKPLPTATSTRTYTNSACGLSTDPLFVNLPIASRTLVPRLDIEGFAKLPNYPFVLGLDANLAQYSVFHRSNIDYLNKAGNDIRIYVGFKIDLNSLVSKLGVSSQ